MLKTSFYSIEINPYKHFCQKCLLKLKPTFCSVVWKPRSGYVLKNPAIAVCQLLTEGHHQVLLHLTARTLNENEAVIVLDHLKNINVSHLLVIQGDHLQGISYKTDFKHACDLIKFIRTRYGDSFCLGIAGYPANDADLENLKMKVNMGANFILTQTVFDYEQYSNFCTKCVELGITIPIIPGLCIIDNFTNFQNFINICNVTPPDAISNILKQLKHKPEALRNFVVYHCSQLVKQLLVSDKMHTKHVHFFSLNNLKLVSKVCDTLCLTNNFVERPLSTSS